MFDFFYFSDIMFFFVFVEIVNYDGYVVFKCIVEVGVIGVNIIWYCNWYIDFD